MTNYDAAAQTASYILTADIDMSGVENFDMIGASSKKPFRGTFDGDGHTIFNLNIHSGSSVYTTGLFYQVYPSATIKNLSLYNANVVSDNMTSKTGALIGQINNVGYSGNVTIENVTVINSTIIAAFGNVGGLIGEATSSVATGKENTFKVKVNNCSSFNNNIGIVANSTTSNGYAGGIIGAIGTDDSKAAINFEYANLSSSNYNANNAVQGKDNVHTGPIAGNYGAGSGNGTEPEIIEGEPAPEPSRMVQQTLIINSLNFVGPVKDCQAGYLYGNKTGNSLTADISATAWNNEDGEWYGWDNRLLSWKNVKRGYGYRVYVWDAERGEEEKKIEGYQLVTLTLNEEPYAQQGMTWNGKYKEIQRWYDGKYINSYEGRYEYDASKDSFVQQGGVTVKSKEEWFPFSNPYGDAFRISDFLFTDAEGNELNTDAIFLVNAVYGNESNNYQGAVLSGEIKGDNAYSQIINPGQGFYVKGTAGSTVTFKGRKAPLAKKSAVTTDSPFKFTVKANGTSRKVYASLKSDASNSIDNRDYSIMLNENAAFVEPYFTVEGKDLIYNSFKSLPYETDINFHALQTSQAVLTVENIPEDVTVSIVDKLNGNETVLNDGNFEFTADEGENNGRYSIRFASKKSSVSDVDVIDAVIWNNNRNITVSGQNLQSVEVLNTLGQTVYNSRISADSYNFDLNAASGSYIVRVNTANGQKVSKIVVK